METLEKKRVNSRQASPLVFAVMGVILVAALGLRVRDFVVGRQPVMSTVTLAGTTFEVEIADTPAKRELGLGKRDSLPEGRGMYFPMGSAQHWSFWMKGMRFPIDIVWIRGGKVVDVSSNIPAPGGVASLRTYVPKEAADAVLELNAGVADENGIVPGVEVVLSLTP